MRETERKQNRRDQRKAIGRAVLTLFLVTVAATLGAEEAKTSNLTAQIFYPLSTNEGDNESTRFNLYLVYGRIGEVRGVDAGYGFSHVQGEMVGFQYTGGGALVGGDLRGVSGGGIFSGVSGAVEGLQWSGVANWSGGEVRGVQSSGVANVAAGGLRGVQAAGVVNVAGDVEGLQAASVVNVAREVRGVQLGLINISERMQGVPIGLINLSADGGVQLSGWYGGITEANAGLRFRSGAFYTLFSYGVSSESYSGISSTVSGTTEISSGFSFGARLPLRPFYINLDAGVLAVDRQGLYSFDQGRDQLGAQYRATVELPLFGGLSVFGGIGSGYLLPVEEEGVTETEGRWEDYYILGAALEL